MKNPICYEKNTYFSYFELFLEIFIDFWLKMCVFGMGSSGIYVQRDIFGVKIGSEGLRRLFLEIMEVFMESLRAERVFL